jgi:hypothetical protein
MRQIDVGITKCSSLWALKMISLVALTLMLLTSQGLVITIDPGQRIQAAIDSNHAIPEGPSKDWYPLESWPYRGISQ